MTRIFFVMEWKKIFTKWLRAQDWLRMMLMPQLHMSGKMNPQATRVSHKVSGTWRDIVLHAWGDQEIRDALVLLPGLVPLTLVRQHLRWKLFSVKPNASYFCVNWNRSIALQKLGNRQKVSSCCG